MMTVSEVSKLTGVSIRTLQYYDRIGFLKASAHSQAGYRYYDTETLERLQDILLFRELEFSLKDIQEILNSPDFAREKALRQQIELLELKRAHIDGLISLAREIIGNGEYTMDFSAFDKKKLQDYAAQAKAQWGGTDAYKAYEKKSQGRSEETENALGKGLMDLFRQLGALKDRAPEDSAVQALIKALQDYITKHYYPCTNEILASLGQMYAAGGEFTENIDAAGGKGTAEFANQAIAVFCKK